MRRGIGMYEKIKLRRFYLCVFLILLAVCLLPKQTMAAEPFSKKYTSSDLYGDYVKQDEWMYSQYEEKNASTAKPIYEGFSEVIQNNNNEKFYYVATEDVDLTLWASEGEDSSTYSRRMEGICSNGYCYAVTQWKKGELGLNLHLKKGDKVYLKGYDVNRRDGTFRLNCSIKKAQPIKNISVVSQLEEEYVQDGKMFDVQAVGTEAIVEVTYADGRKQMLQAGYNQYWTADAPSSSDELGTYNYTLYYRDYPISLRYQLKSYTDFIKLIPIEANKDVEVSYNNGEYVGYSFVPEKTGLYNVFCDEMNNKEQSPFLIYEKDGRMMKSLRYMPDEYTELFMLAGVEYQIYIKKQEKDSKITFWIEDCLEYLAEGLQVSTVEQQWYQGEPVCPKPRLSYKGTDVTKLDIGYVEYSYIRNNKVGMAAVVLEYQFYDEYIRLQEGSVRIPFMIRGAVDQAQIEVPTYTYTGKAIVPDEKVMFYGKTLVRGQDYKVNYANNINAGTAVMSIEGMGNYEGKLTKPFVIQKAQQEINVKDNFITHKGAKTFSLKAKAKGKLSYSGGKKKIAKVNKKGKVSVKGYGKVTLTIKAKETKNYLPASKKVLVVVTSKPSKIQSVQSKSKNKMTIKVKKATGAQGYEISYSTDKNFQTGVVTKQIKKRKVTFKKLTSKKTYYVRVRSYRKVKGKKLYSAYSPIKKVRIR